MLFGLLRRAKHKCSQRRNIGAYVKNQFQRLYPSLLESLSSNSLPFALSFGLLASQMGKEGDTKLFASIKSIARLRKDRLNKDRAMQLAQVISKFSFTGDERFMLQDFRDFFRENRDSFSLQQKQTLERLFSTKQNEMMVFGQFYVNFHQPVAKVKQRPKPPRQQITIERNGRKAKLVGVTHGDIKQLLKLKQQLRRGSPKTVILQMPSLLASQVRPKGVITPFKKHSQLLLDAQSRTERSISFPLRVLQPQDLEFYVKDYLQFRRSMFQIRKSQDLVYYWDREWLPHEFASLMYSQFVHNGKNRFILADLTLQEQIQANAANMTLPQCKAAFSFLRVNYLIQQINFLKHAVKKGCEECKGQKYQLFSPVSYTDPDFYSFQGRERSMASQIKQCLEDPKQQGDIVGVFGADHIQSIAKLIDKPHAQIPKVNGKDPDLVQKLGLLSALYDDELQFTDQPLLGRAQRGNLATEGRIQEPYATGQSFRQDQ